METLDIILTGIIIFVLILLVLVVVQKNRWNNINGLYEFTETGRDAFIISKSDALDSDGNPVFTINYENENYTIGPIIWTITGGERHIEAPSKIIAVIRMELFSTNNINITKNGAATSTTFRKLQ